MAENENDFDLVRLDQQIEHPAGSLDAQARHVVEDLRRMSRPTPSDIRANTESLRRVQRLLQARFEPARQETKIVPLRVTQTRQERKSLLIAKTNERKPGWQRLSRPFNTLAAVLVVAVLIGSAAILANLKNHAQNGGNTQVGASTQATATPTATPLPKLDCSHIFTEDNSMYPDNGEHAVCLQGAEMPLQGTTEMNGHKLTLVSAYADTNRLLIKYVVSGKDLDRYDGGPGISQFLIQDPAQTLSFGQQDAWSIGGGWGYDSQKNQTNFLASYPTQNVVPGTTSLKVTVDFGAVVGATTANPAGTGTDTASFVFSVPLHTQRRVVTPNQSVIINGHHVTLTQVVITASAAYLFVKTDKILMTSQPVVTVPSATVNGSNNITVTPTTNGTVNGKWDPVTGFSLGAPEDWLATQGTWTLSLRSTALPLGIGSGTIQFTVPPTA